MSTRIFIIRHGESVANLEHFYAGQNNIPLTEFGIEQAKVAAEAFKNEKIDKVYSSTLDRAYYTALPFAEMRGLTVERDPRLVELDVGEWTGKTFTEVETLYSEERRLWREDPMRTRINGGESCKDLINRIGQAIDDIARKNDGLNVLVASHGGAIRTIPYYFAENKVDSVYTNTPISTNCSITEVCYENGVGRLVRYSDDSYLKDLKSGAFII